MPLFRSSPKSPQELVKSLRDALAIISSTEGSAKKADKVISSTATVVFTITASI